MERQKRKRNVVLSGVPESTEPTGMGRIRADLLKLKSIVQSGKEGTFVSCYRAGRKRPGRHRLLIATTSSPSVAEEFHGYGSGRKFHLSHDSGIVWCNPDLIRADRIASYKARQLEKDRRTQLQEKFARQSKPTSRHTPANSAKSSHAPVEAKTTEELKKVFPPPKKPPESVS